MNQSEDVKSSAALNLYQKLVNVRKSCDFIKKSAQGYGFKYATEGDLLGAIREEMDNQGVFLEVEHISLEPIECLVVTKEKQRVMVPGLRCVYEFIWTNADNPSEQIKKRLIMQDSEQDAQTCGALLTYAMKYFLFKFFSVPTDDRDPDKSPRKSSDLTEGSPSPVPPANMSDTLTTEELEQLAWRHKNNPEIIGTYLSKYGVEMAKDLPRSCYPQLIKDYTREFMKSKGEKR